MDNIVVEDFTFLTGHKALELLLEKMSSGLGIKKEQLSLCRFIDNASGEVICYALSRDSGTNQKVSINSAWKVPNQLTSLVVAITGYEWFNNTSFVDQPETWRILGREGRDEIDAYLNKAGGLPKALREYWNNQKMLFESEDAVKASSLKIARKLWWKNNIADASNNLLEIFPWFSKEKVLKAIAVAIAMPDDEKYSSTQYLFNHPALREKILKEFPNAPVDLLGKRKPKLLKFPEANFEDPKAMELLFEDVELFLQDYDAWLLSSKVNRSLRRQRALYVRNYAPLDQAPKEISDDSSMLEIAAYIRANLEVESKLYLANLLNKLDAEHLTMAMVNGGFNPKQQMLFHEILVLAKAS